MTKAAEGMGKAGYGKDKARKGRDGSMAQVNIWVNAETHRKAKILAVVREETLNGFLLDAIEGAVEKEKGVLRELLDEKR